MVSKLSSTWPTKGDRDIIKLHWTVCSVNLGYRTFCNKTTTYEAVIGHNTSLIGLYPGRLAKGLI
jgi:hypothetical protein